MTLRSMGRFLRLVFAGVGIVSLLLSVEAIVSALEGPPGPRAPLIAFGVAMGLFSLTFVRLLRKPFFSRRSEGDRD